MPIQILPVHWPPWVSWLLLLAILITLYIVWQMARNVGAMRHALAETGAMRGRAPARNRQELEEKYTRGAIDREVYDRWKERLR